IPFREEVAFGFLDAAAARHADFAVTLAFKRPAADVVRLGAEQELHREGTSRAGSRTEGLLHEDGRGEEEPDPDAERDPEPVPEKPGPGQGEGRKGETLLHQHDAGAVERRAG